MHFVIEEHEAINRNAFVSIPSLNLNESDYDIAVVDKKKRLRGVISNEDVVSALSH